MLDRIRRILAHRYLALGLIALATALLFPCLKRKLAIDDLLHRLMLLRQTAVRGFVDHPIWGDSEAGGMLWTMKNLFAFIDPTTVNFGKNLGMVPWWAHDELRLAFFRPLTSLTHWIDYQLWPDSTALMHLHSLLWFLGVVALAVLVYRRLLGPTWIAGLAALLFTVEDAHFSPIVWLANRNALVALLFGLMALIAHDRWRRRKLSGKTGEGTPWRPGAILAPLLLALSLLSAEAGLATAAYLVAHVLFLDPARWRTRIGILLTYAAVILVWRVALVTLGYGVHGSGFYVDPLQDTGLFLGSVVDNGPLLLWGQLGWPDPVMSTILSSPTRRVLWLATIGLLVLVGLLFVPLLRRDRVARFWAVGMVLCLLPICARRTMPAGALLVFAGVGGMGLLAQLIGGLVDRAKWLPTRRSWRLPAWVFGVFALLIHGVLAPVTLCTSATQELGFKVVIEQANAIDPIPGMESKEVVIVNSPGKYLNAYLPLWRLLSGQSLPAHLRVLAPGYLPLQVTRIDTHTLRVRPKAGFIPPPEVLQEPAPAMHFSYINLILDQIFRSPKAPMTRGEEVRLQGMTARVLTLTEDGRPLEVSFRFHRPLDDRALVWLQWDWQKKAYKPFVPPPVGKTINLPGIY